MRNLDTNREITRWGATAIWIRLAASQCECIMPQYRPETWESKNVCPEPPGIQGNYLIRSAHAQSGHQRVGIRPLTTSLCRWFLATIVFSNAGYKRSKICLVRFKGKLTRFFHPVLFHIVLMSLGPGGDYAYMMGDWNAQ